MNKPTGYIYNLGLAFENIVSQHADKTALIFTDNQIATFNDLNSKANKIANFLTKRGIKQRDVIAIFNNKSLEAYSIMIACLKLGVTYTNLDMSSPLERLKKMLSVSDPVCFLVPDESISALNEINFPDEKTCTYSNSTFIEQLDKIDEGKINLGKIDGYTPAYLMFTSGSTGFPKGVVISHTNVLNFISWSQKIYQSGTNDVFTNINPMHFDNSVFDFYASIFTGASMIPVSEKLTKNPRKLILTLNSLNPTIWFSVPSMLIYVLKLRALNSDDLTTLRIVTFGGEGFPKGQLRNLWKLWGKRVKFINVYGPTECTCICSSYVVSDEDMKLDDLLPLGPIAENFGHIIINSKNEIIDSDEIGELCITGPNVGLGYYRDTTQTSKAFIQTPLHTNYPEIVYKSGDLVKYNKQRNVLQFCGRTDNQIKRMGYRIELEEIENVLGALEYIEESAVIYHKGERNNGKILAFVRFQERSVQKINNDIKNSLPSYMMPDEFFFYDHLPKNQNGKIDRLQLKEDYLNKLSTT